MQLQIIQIRRKYKVKKCLSTNWVRFPRSSRLLLQQTQLQDRLPDANQCDCKDRNQKRQTIKNIVDLPVKEPRACIVWGKNRLDQDERLYEMQRG